MLKFIQHIPILVILLISTTLEVSGDALIRKCVYNYTGVARIAFGLFATALVFGYSFFLNLAPVKFNEVVGLYIATLFVVWQIVNYFAFHTLPTFPIIIGGVLIVSGGLFVTYWK